MSTLPDRQYCRLALVAALAASLGLTACGRKGSLDPPPSASVTGEPQASADALLTPVATPIGGRAADGNPGVDKNGQAMAPKGPKKSIPLDVLLN